MTDVVTAFLLIGAIIFVGFLGLQFFERTGVPDLLILMVIGSLLGPVFQLVDATPFVGAAPFFASLALIILLFEGGMTLNINKVFARLARASTYTLLVFVLELGLITLAIRFLFGWEWLPALFLAAASTGTSGAIVIPLLERVRTSDDTRIVLDLESALTDALTILAALTVLQLMVSQTVDLGATANSLAAAFSIAAVFGAIIGFAWLRFLHSFRGKPFGYLLTLAVSFMLYGVVEAVKGNGAIAVFVFGILLGNAAELSRFFRLKESLIIDETIRHFQSEVGFFVRTFFFVYIGLLIQPSLFTSPYLLPGLVILAAIALSRHAGASYLTRGGAAPGERLLLTLMMPRGLAAAVLVSLPASRGISLPGFVEVLLLLLVLSNVVTTAGVFWYEREFGRPIARALESSRGPRAQPAPHRTPRVLKVK
jgi:cell volume regulation protein A